MKNEIINPRECFNYLPKTIIEIIIKHKSVTLSCPYQIEMSFIIMSIKITGITSLPHLLNNNEKITAEYFGITLNPIIEQITLIITQNGGEVFKYDNEILIVLWKCRNNDKHQHAKASIQCSYMMLSEIEPIKTNTLELMIGIGYGRGYIGFVGGYNGINEFIIYGEAMDKSEKALALASNKKVIVNKGFMDLINDYDLERKINEEFYQVSLKSITEKIIIIQQPIDYANPQIKSIIEKKKGIIKSFIPNYIKMLIEEKTNIFKQEILQMTIQSIKVTFPSFPFIEEIQQIILIIQKCIYMTNGIILSISVVDIYSIAIICGWGNIMNTHYDDPSRAISSAILINKSLSFIDIKSRIGITTGFVFCSLNTSNNGKQYYIYGKSICLSQILMKISDKYFNSSNYSICFDEKTQLMIQNHFKCKYEGCEQFRGYQSSTFIYSPIITVFIPSQYDPFPLIRTHEHNSINSHSEPSSSTLMKSLIIIGMNKEITRMQKIMKSVIAQRTKQFFMIKGYMGTGKSLYIRKVLNNYIGQDDYLSSIYFNKQSSTNEHPLFLFVSYQTPLIVNYPYNGIAFIFRQIYLSLLKSKYLNLVNNQITKMICDSKSNNRNDIDAIDLILSIYHNKDIDVHSLIELPKRYCQEILYPPYKIHNPKHLNNFFMMLLTYYRNYITSFYKQSIPLILVIEDTHLIDSYSIQFLHELFDLSSEIFNPIIIIMSYQIPFHSSLEIKDNNSIANDIKLFGKTDLLLAEVNDKETISNLIKPIHDIETMQKILTFYYHDKSIERIEFKLLRFIISKTFGGIPLLAIQLMDSLIRNIRRIQTLPEEIIITSEFNDDIELLDWQEFDMPFLQTKIIQKAINHLNLKQIHLLKISSIIGTLFDSQTLIQLLSLKCNDYQIIKKQILSLENDEIIESLYEDKEHFVNKFSIPFLRETLLNMIPLTYRTDYHVQIAQAFTEGMKIRYLSNSHEIQIINRHLAYSERAIQTEIVSGKSKYKENNSKSYLMLQLNSSNIAMKRRMIEQLATLNHDNLESQFSIFMHGTITKKCIHKSEWEKRYGVLTKDLFVYYHSLSEIKERKGFIGMIKLKNVYDVMVVLDDSPFNGRKNLFSIYTRRWIKNKFEMPERTFIFSCESKENLSQWVFYLKTICFNVNKVSSNLFCVPFLDKASMVITKDKYSFSLDKLKQSSSRSKSCDFQEKHIIQRLFYSFKKITIPCFLIIMGHIQSYIFLDYYDNIEDDYKLIPIPYHLSRPIKSFFSQLIRIDSIENEKGRRPFGKLRTSSQVKMIKRNDTDENDIDLSSSDDEYIDNNYSENEDQIAQAHFSMRKNTYHKQGQSNSTLKNHKNDLSNTTFNLAKKGIPMQRDQDNDLSEQQYKNKDFDKTKSQCHMKIHSTSFFSDLRAYKDQIDYK